MDNCIVYVHIAPNGKLYIGISHNTLEARSGHGANYYSQHFTRAIKKYGWDNFSHITLMDHLTWEQAVECEKYLIKKYKSNNPDFGYNITAGGEGTYGYHHSEQTRNKISESNKGKLVSKETRQKLSEYNKQLNKEHPERLVQKSMRSKELWLNEDYRNKQVISHTGKHHSAEQIQKIKDGNKGKVYSQETRSKISEIVKAQHENERALGIKRKTRSKPVEQYTTDGVYVQTFNSGKAAAEYIGVHPTSISDCCKGRIKVCKGYIWKFAKW